MAKEAIPYPDLPDLLKEAAGPQYAFALAAYLRDLAELEALEHFTQRRDFGRQSKPFRYAIFGATLRTRESAAKWLARVVEEGGLLYAWAPDAKGGAR
jgi:hypothetical protein